MEWFRNLKLSHKIIIVIMFESIFLFLIGLVGYYYSQYSARYVESAITIVLISVAIILSIILGLFMTQLILDPIKSLTNKMKEVAKGNYFVEPMKAKAGSDINEMNAAFNTLRENLQHLIQNENILQDRNEFLRKILISSISSLDIKNILQTIVVQTGQYFKADRCYFVEYNEEIDDYMPIKDYEVYLSSLNIKDPTNLKITREQAVPITKITFGQKQVLEIDNIDTIELPEDTKKIVSEYNIKSFISAPIFYGNTPLGRLTLNYVNEYHHFTQEDVDLISTIANQSAIMIHQGKLYKCMQETSKREQLLREIILSSICSLDIKDILRTIVKKTGELFNADRCFFIEYVDQTREYLPVKTYQEYIASPELKTLSEREFLREELSPFAKIMMDQRKIIAVDNVQESNFPEITKNMMQEFKIKSFLSIPMFYENIPLGNIVIHFVKDYKHFAKEDIDLLLTVAQQSAIVIHQAELFMEVNVAKDREKLLRTISDTIRSSLDIDEVLKLICEETGKIFKVQRVSIAQSNPYLIRNEYISSPNVKRLLGRELGKEVIEFWSTAFVAGNDSIIIDNIYDSYLSEHIKEFYKKIDTKSIIGIPIKSNGEHWGNFVLAQTSEFRHWTEEEINLLKVISDQIFRAIKQAELYSYTKKEAERAALIRKIIETIGSTLDLNDVLVIICQEILKLFKVDRVAIWNFNRESNYTEWENIQEAKSSPDIIGVQDFEYPANLKNFIGIKVLEEDQYLVIDNIEKCNYPDFFVQAYNYMKTKSLLVLPIKKDKDKWGILVLAQVNNYKSWKKDEIELLSVITDQIYIAIRQAELYTSTKNYADRENLLRRIMEIIRSSLDIKHIKQSIANEVGKALNADRCFIRIYEQGIYQPAEAEYLADPNSKSIIGYQFPEEANKYFTTLHDQQKIVYLPNTDEIPENTPECKAVKQHLKSINIKSNYGFPIFEDGNPMGAIVIQFNDKHIISNEDIELMQVIANQAGIALKQSELYTTTKNFADRENLLRTLISNTLMSTSLYDAIRNITSETGKLFDADRTCFMFFDNDLQSFSEIVGEYRKRDDMPSTEGNVILQKDFEDFLIKELFVNKNILIFDSNNNIKFPESFKKYLNSLGIKNSIAAPIFYKDVPMGVILITNTESRKKWSKEELDFFVPIAQQISIGINLFKLNEVLSKKLNSERAIRDIILESRRLDDHDLIVNYLLEKLVNVFNVKRALHIHHDDNNDLFVKNEILKDKNLKSLVNQKLLRKESTFELEPRELGKCVIVNDVKTEITDINLKSLFINNEINAFITYPRPKVHPDEDRGENFDTMMVCSTVPRKWSSNDTSSLKLIVDTSSIIYFETLHRKESDEIKQTFLATLTHDLRSPLNAEQKTLEAIISEKFGTSLENYSEYLKDIYRTNEELLRIVNNILMTYHYESGAVELNLESSDIKILIEEAVNLMRPLAADQNSNIKVSIEDYLPELMINKDEISRVIINLLSNAIKHNQKGTDINISAVRINNEVQVSVKDNGKGIPQPEQANIFQRYPTTKRKIGTGLGLYLSKQIIDAHHGKIWFETEENKGTTFFFTLPVA